MSDYINPDKSRTWLDGDAFRAPLGTALPPNIFAASLSGWTAFGGIKAGFNITRDRENTDINIWNNRTGSPWKRRKGDIATTIAFRPVEYSVATTLTLIRGGSVSAAAGGFEHVEGEDEQFAFIMRVLDGSEQKAYFVAKCELLTLPEEAMGAEDDVEGWDLELGPLAPSDGTKAVRKFTNTNPLAA